MGNTLADLNSNTLRTVEARNEVAADSVDFARLAQLRDLESGKHLDADELEELAELEALAAAEPVKPVVTSARELFDVLPSGETMQLSHADDVLKEYGLPRLTELLADHFNDQQRKKSDAEKLESARQQASAQVDGINEMVAALECDYDRLEELKEEREALQEAVFDALEAVDDAHAEYIEASEEGEINEAVEARESACETLADAENDLYQFGRENAEELAELIEAAGDCDDKEEAEQRIQEDPLEVSIRSGWYTPGEENPDVDEFKILLCTGGPAVRIVGELDQYKQPSRAWIEYQDWFTSWTEYHGDNVSHGDLLTYCQQFYFGE